MVENNNALVTSKLSRAEYEDARRMDAIHTYFSGSLPQFLNAFVREKKLSAEDIAELESIIDSYKNSPEKNTD